MPVNANQTITLDINNPEYIIPKGYHSGEGKVKVEPYVAKMVSSDIEQSLTADDGKVISGVEVKGISKEPAPMNIVYGLAAPGIADRDKLWVKTAQEPSEVIVNSDFNGTMEYEYDVGISPNTGGAGVVSADDRIFFCSASTNMVGVYGTGKVYEYDTKTQSYKEIGTCQEYSNPSAFIVGEWLHIMGGKGFHTSTGAHYKININTYEKITCANAEYTSRGAVVGTNIFTFGGSKETYETKYTNAIRKYDTINNTWTNLTNFPSSMRVSGGIAVPIDKIIYFFYQNNLYLFNTQNYILSDSIKSIAFPRAAIDFGTDIWLFYDTTITILDTLTLKTKQLDCISSISSNDIRVRVGNNSIYTCGERLHRLNLYSELPYNTLQLVPSLAENMFEIYPNFEIGIQNAYIGDSAGKSQWVNVYLYNTELQQWINIRTGLADETDAWQTGDSVYIVNAEIAEEDDETIIIEKGES